MNVEIYTVNEGTEYEYYCLQYADSDILIREFNTRRGAERYANKNGYNLI